MEHYPTQFHFADRVQLMNVTWKDLHQWRFKQYDIFHFIIAASYAILLVSSVLMFTKFRYSSKVFKITFLAGSVIRLFFFTIQPFVREGILVFANSINFILNTLPAFLFFTTYTFLLSSWANIFRKNTQIHKPGYVFIVFNVLMYIIMLTMYILDMTMPNGSRLQLDNPVSDPTSVYEQGVLLTLSIMYICVSFGFFIYGYFTWRYSYYDENTGHYARLPQSKKALRKIGTITLACMVVFIVRSAITLWAVFDTNMSSTWWLDGVYFILLEVCPMLLMLGTYVDPQEESERSPLIQEESKRNYV